MNSSRPKRFFLILFVVVLSFGLLTSLIDKVAGRSITEEKIEAVWAQIFPVKFAGTTVPLHHGFRVAYSDEKRAIIGMNREPDTGTLSIALEADRSRERLYLSPEFCESKACSSRKAWNETLRSGVSISCVNVSYLRRNVEWVQSQCMREVPPLSATYAGPFTNWPRFKAQIDAIFAGL